MSWFSNGASQYATIPNDARLRYMDTDHAFGLWFRRSGDSTGGDAGYLFGHDGGTVRNILGVRNSDETSPNLITLFVRDAGSDQVALTSTSTVTNGEWVHVVSQRSGNTQYLYVNGVEEASADATAVAADDPSAVFRIFDRDATTNFRFNGYIAELFRIDRALTTTEITALAAGTRPTELVGAVDDLHFFVPMDSDEFKDHFNRFSITSVGLQATKNIRPPVDYPLVTLLSDFVLNPCKDTSYGVIDEGENITLALQEAVNSGSKRIWVPHGNYVLDDTITLPYRIGGSLLGMGMTHPIVITEALQGVATTFSWEGTAGEPMFKLTGEGWEVGNFGLIGKANDQTVTANIAGVGILVTRNGNTGIGTGSTIFRPLWIESCTYAVQVGSSGGESNCDNLYFEWLRAHFCTAAYRGLNSQGVDITINHLQNSSNTYAFLMEGGGELHCRRSITVDASTTFLRLPTVDSSISTGKYTGNLHFSNTKIDSRAGTDFTLVDSDNDKQLSILFDSGQYSEDTSVSDPFVKVKGRNMLTFLNYASTFNKIVGVASSGYTPTVNLESCRLWDTDGPVYEGELNFRMTNTRLWNGTLVPDFPVASTVTVNPPADLYRTGVQNMAAVPKASQSYQGTYDCTVAATDAGQVVANCTKARIVLRTGYNQGTEYDKNSTDHSSYVTVPSSGAGTYTIVAADFGSASDKLKAGTNYYVVKEYTFSDGTVQEAKEIERLRFALDQV